MDRPPLVEPSTNPPPPLPPTTSLPARLLNVFATPGEVFEEVASAPRAVRNWLVPALIACFVTVTSVVILFSQPTIQQQVREQQQAALDKNVKAGKMTQAQADQAVEMMGKFAGVIAGIGGLFWAFASIFVLAFGLWLLALWIFKADLNYMKAVEVVSLAGMISVLHQIVTLLLRVNLGNASSSTNLALLVGKFDPENPLHLVLAMLDLFVIWYLIVLAIGFSKLMRVAFGRVFFVLTLAWFIVHSILMLGALLSVKMFT